MDSRTEIPSPLQSCIIENIQLGELIHYGTYSKVVEAKWEGTVVAVKQLYDVYEQVFDITKCETKCDGHQLGHANIVRFFGIYFPPGAMIPSFVMERLDGSLYDLLKRNPTIPIVQNPAIPVETKLSILHQTGLGLRYLHSRVPPIIYGKLSSKKVLISKGMEAKIACIGTIINIECKARYKTIRTAKQFDLDFAAPEVTTSKTYGKEVDVFSFGRIMLYTLSATLSDHVISDPVAHRHAMNSQEGIKYCIRYLDKSIRDVILPLIMGCLKHRSSEQPSVIEVCHQLETLLVGKNHSQQIPQESKSPCHPPQPQPV